MEEEVKISREFLKTISVDTRVDILKALEERPMTASELSRFLNKHVTTISEHLEILKKSNLVERVERPGRKWVYYRLTREGKRILHPTSYRWVMVLSVSFIAILVGLFIWNVEAYPGDFLYPVKRARESLELFFTLSESERVDKHINLAEERLKEAKVLIERGREDLAKEIVSEYTKQIERVGKEVKEKATFSNLETLSESTSKTIFMLQNLKVKAPKLSEEINLALNVSLETHRGAVRQLGKITGRAYSSAIP
ncbi:MAG: DUF5667 domain-containing protein [Candidatus Aenigmatarchaeota archaeon]